MKRNLQTYAITAFFILLQALTGPVSAEDMDMTGKLSEEINATEEHPKYTIYPEKDALFCSGDDIAGRENNRAASLMLEGKWSEASEIYENLLLHAPLFFPYRYNLGICLLYQNRLRESLMHFTKALHLVPEYYRIYLQIGYIYGRLNRESDALLYFRKALKLHPRDLNTYILMGDIHFNRKQLASARKYYEKALTLDSRFPNGLLGLAKIHFINEEFLKAIILLKSVDISGDYDKSLHYYYAESAFKSADYRTAVREYENLLKFRNDRFFLVNSELLIRHKLELSRRFTER